MSVFPLSDKTVHRCLSDMALNVKEQVLVLEVLFSIHIDKSDVASCAQVMTYMRYIREHVQEEFPLWQKKDLTP